MAQTLSHDILAAALAGFKLEQQRLEEKIAHVQAMLKSSSIAGPAPAPNAPSGKHKKFSAASRRRMAEAQKARWAKLKGEAESAPEATPEPVKAKRKLSAAGRRAIAAATRKRWALKRAEEAAKAEPAAARESEPKPKAAKKSAAPKKAVKKAAARATKKAAIRKTAAPAPVVAATTA